MTHEPDWKQDQAETSRLKPAMTQAQTMLELADWLLSEQARFASSIACNDPAVKSHIATLKKWESEVRVTTTATSPIGQSDVEMLKHLADGMGFGRTHNMLRRVIEACPYLATPSPLPAPGEVAGGGEEIAHVIKDISDDVLYNIATEAWSAAVDSSWSSDGLEAAVIAVRSAVEEAKPLATLSPGGGAVEALQECWNEISRASEGREDKSDSGLVLACAMIARRIKRLRAALSALPPAQADGADTSLQKTQTSMEISIGAGGNVGRERSIETCDRFGNPPERSEP